ncbi:MAG: DUF262 domain-containing protein [Planctomycetes bacterium]|nr:DUF262 domain-containing protein [Planctomycetota bacterium]
MPPENAANNGDLAEVLEAHLTSVRTKSLDQSFNELLDMYADAELIISPEYQRLFRWSLGKQSRFIESLLLELPVPPLYVIETADGVYELIDGLQRLSSYLHFRGELQKLDEPGEKLVGFSLEECDIAPELNGKSYQDLPSSLRIRLKRSYVRVEVIRKESDQRLRYFMFKRLNTGGELLSEQELRNCTIRLLSTTFNDFLAEMSGYPAYKLCISNVSDNKVQAKYDQELVLRFFALKNWRAAYIHEVGEFLTEYMEAVSDVENQQVTFDFDGNRACFKKTFDVLNTALGDRSFSAINAQGTFVTRFLVYHFEAFSLGIQSHLDSLNADNGAQMAQLASVMTDIKNDGSFRDLTTGGGKNYPGPLKDRIEFVENKMSEKTW